MEFKSPDSKPLKHATVKAKGEGVETLPLYTNKDTIAGQVNFQIANSDCRPTIMSAKGDAQPTKGTSN